MKQLPCLAGAVCAFALLFSPDVTAQTLVVPNGYATTEANSSSAYPWNRTSSAITIQYVYDTTTFSGITQPIIINKLRWRANGSTSGTWTGGTYNNMTITMSSSTNDYLSMSNTFSANHGVDKTVVHQGQVTVAPQSTPGGIPNVWYVTLPLTTPFIYDPTKGSDLLIEFGIPAGTWTGGTSYSIDLISGSTQTPPAAGTRLWALSFPATTATSNQTNLNEVMEITYTPAQGLFASFTASPTTGGQNLKVQFTDTSFSSDPAGIQSWAWDFDGDNKVDSTVQNPTFTYTCGKYSPSLTVTDKVHKPSMKVQKDLIEAGLVAAGFNVTGATRGVTPFQVSFTNTSTGPVTVYQWDFDGDNKVDSTQKDPMFIYTKDGTYDVKLTVIGPCNQDSATQKGLIKVGEICLSTLFTGGNGLSANDSGNMFDVNVKNPNGVKITSMDVSSRAAAPTSITIDVYITPNTWSGNENNGAVWTQVSTGTAASQGSAIGTLTPVDIADFFLAPGKYGMYINFKNGGVHYTNGTTTNNFYSNADLELTLGIGKGALFGGATNNPRIWNGTICYVAQDKAASGAYGFGCPGTNSKTPRLSLSADPVLGTSVKFDITDMVNTAAGVGLFFVGVKNTQTDLTANGMPNCALFNEALVTLGFVNVAGSGSLSSKIPNNTGLVSYQFFTQAANADFGANPLGVAASNGLAVRVGNQ